MAEVVDITNLVDPWRLALRYNNSPSIRKIYDGLGAVVANSSLWDFYKFFDVNEAAGTWLDRLGKLYNINRPVGLTGSVFVLDIDALDDESVMMDGLTESLADSIYRNLFKLLTESYLKFASVDTLTDLFEGIFGGNNELRCEVIEDYMSFTIYLYFANPSYVKVLYTILDINPHIIGDFPGVDYTIIPTFMNPPPEAQ